MEKLDKAYEAIEMLRALNLPVSEEQLRGIARLEKEYLQEEIIPLLKLELEPLVKNLKGQFKIEITCDKELGLTLTIKESAERRKESPIIQNSETSTRDNTKYSIDGGEPLKKRRLVLAVVRKYVESHPGISYEELKQRFPDSLSGSPLHGVFQNYNTVLAKLENQPDLRKRFFLEEQDLIELSDGTKLTVYNQWGAHFPNFLEVAKQIHRVESHNND